MALASPINITVDDRQWVEYAYNKFPKVMSRAAREALSEGLDYIGLIATSKYMKIREFDPETKKIGSRSGEKLNIMTGRLSRSINQKLSFAQGASGEKESIRRVFTFGDDVFAEIGSKVPYARIHEFGGNAGIGGKAKIPPRPYLNPAIVDSEKYVFRLMMQKLDFMLT